MTGDPVWLQYASDYKFEDLALDRRIEIPQEITQGREANIESGLQGELIIYSYFLQQKQSGLSKIREIRWKNSEDESYLPYDFEVDVATNAGIVTDYVEVKSTLSDQKQVFEISAQQLKFAQVEKEHFHIYRVFNAGDLEHVRIVPIKNLSLRLDQKHVKLCMVI